MRLIIYLYICLLSLSYVILIGTEETEVENKEKDVSVKQTGCTCVKYKCKCCENLNWQIVNLNGLICIKVKYLAEDIGISLSVNYNNTDIVQEDVSVRRLFPLCIKQIFSITSPVVMCIQMYDTIISSEKIHICFNIEGSFYKFKLPPVKLGCINLMNNQNTTKNNQLKRILFNTIDDLGQWKYGNRDVVELH